ncbi:MAG: hypothetical protein GX766_06685 [Firmicutes bacterium]|jgi:flagellar FliL protein|nr:hypothetical protein [Bacillota bacterium]HOB22828.1 flagellar basal body-associated FliL family protein [Bacillota bacterium]
MAEKELSTSRMLTIGIVAIVVATLGTSFLTSYLLRGDRPAAEQNTRPKNLVTMPVGDFTVNLADQGGNHYLRTSISLAVKSSALANLQAEEPQIRDITIGVLRSKEKAALQDKKGLEALRKELLDRLNQALGEGKVFAIYFTDFVVQ